MPLSKARQAKWMREYRVNKKILGITTNKSRGMGISVIPKPSENYDVVLAVPFLDLPEFDADGNQIYDD